MASSVVLASDPSPLQYFCVTDKASPVLVNGFVCKNPMDVNAEDFFFSGLNMPGNTNKRLGSNVTAVDVKKIAGLNTLGISLARIDFAPYGLNPPHTHPRATEIAGLNTLGVSLARIDYTPFGVNPPHTHPRATEILTVIEGTLLVGFITSNPQNRLIFKVLNAGDVFVFPQGIIHFQFNRGHKKAVAMAHLGSQNPGRIEAKDVFGSNPKIDASVLAKAFQVDKKVMDYLQSRFGMDNNN
ncbi:putative germin-like protein 2-1 [Acorus calamus]|uniref:Germin-like protein n=1 Tax=Acorus calamus TaxID=4465 RepID=A0AAV9FIA3_ACOCL|nr:putative germin-like protein 2-1 [Acorus calamus]